MNVHVLCFTDRPHYFERTYASFCEQVRGEWTMTVIHDEEHRLGFAGAIAAGWAALPPDATHVFHLEDDFEFLEPVHLPLLVDILDFCPHVVQVAYKRQPWSDAEHAVGGIVEMHPQDYEETKTPWGPITIHRRFFTTNPSMYRAQLTKLGWPQIRHSEGMFTHQLIRDPEARFAFLGAPFDPPRVRHIGETRVGIGY